MDESAVGAHAANRQAAHLSEKRIQMLDRVRESRLSLVHERAHLFAHLVLVQVPGVLCLCTWAGRGVRCAGDAVDL